MKYFVVFIVVAALLGAGAFYFFNHEKALAAGAASTQPMQPVVRTTIEKLVSANGTVASNRDVDIKCQASGIVQTLPYNDINAKVNPGEIVCKLDPKDEQPLLDTAQAVVDADNARLNEANLNYSIAKMALETQKSRDQATLASTQARAAQAKAKAVRTKQLFDAKLESQEDLETDQTAAASADADVQTAQAAIAEEDQQKISVDTKAQTIEEMKSALKQDTSRRDQAKLNVQYCTVTAPEATDPSDPPKWVISSLLTNIAPGYIVQSGTSGFSAGTTIMTLSDLSHIFVLASVDESDIGSVVDPAALVQGQHAPGQRVRVKVDAYPNEIFEGVVTRVAPKGVNTSNVVTFEVKVEVDSANRLLLRPAMTATVQIVCASRPDVLAIPWSAFTRGQSPSARADEAQQVTVSVPADAMVPGEPGAAAPTTRRGGRGRNRASSGGVMEAGSPPQPGQPIDGTVVVIKADGSQETRNVTVGLTDGDLYEVISGLQEGENVAINKNGADSKWKGQNPNGSFLPRGMGGGGGGRSR